MWVIWRGQVFKKNVLLEPENPDVQGIPLLGIPEVPKQESRKTNKSHTNKNIDTKSIQ